MFCGPKLKGLLQGSSWPYGTPTGPGIALQKSLSRAKSLSWKGCPAGSKSKGKDVFFSKSGKGVGLGTLEKTLENTFQSFEIKPKEKKVSAAVDLLLGVKKEEATDKKYPGVVSLANRKLSLPLEILMAADDPNDSAK